MSRPAIPLRPSLPERIFRRLVFFILRLTSPSLEAYLRRLQRFAAWRAGVRR